MTSVLLDGWYGRRNTGDDAFCVVGALEYRRHLPHAAVTVLADARGIPALPVGTGVATYKSGVRGVRRAAALLTAARRAAVIHLGGSRFDRPTTSFMRDQAALASVGAIRLHAQAVSIGPFASPSDAAMQAAFLSRFTSISVRDAASLQRAREIGLERVVQAFDVAVLFPGLAGVAERPGDALIRRQADGYPGGPVIGVAVRDLDPHEHEDPRVAAQRERRVTAALRSLAARFPELRVRFLCFGAADARASIRIAAALGPVCRTETQRYSRDPAVMLRAIAGCDVVLAMRLHAAIFSYALRVPFAVIDYHTKCGDFGRDVQIDRRLAYPVGGPQQQQREHLVAAIEDPARHYRPPGFPLDAARDLAERSFQEVGRHLAPRRRR